MLCNSQGNAIKSKQPTCGGWDHSNQHQPFFQISIYYLTRRAFYFFGANVGPGCIWSMLNECFNSLKFLNKGLHPLPYGNICLFSFSISSWVSNTNSLYFSKDSALASLNFFASGHEPSSSTQLCGLLHPGEPGRSGVIRCAQGAQLEFHSNNCCSKWVITQLHMGQPWSTTGDFLIRLPTSFDPWGDPLRPIFWGPCGGNMIGG